MTTIRHVVERVFNITLSDPAWKQASLQANFGGLGFKCAEDLALPAFIASATAAMPLANSLYSLLGKDILLLNAKVNWLATETVNRRYRNACIKETTRFGGAHSLISAQES